MSDFRPPNVQTNFVDSNGDDLGEKLVTKDYLISVYPSLRPGLGVTPEIWGWGSGFDGTLTSYSTPTTTLSTGGIEWRTISCGEDFNLGIKRDGTLWTWGTNNYGQLGTNDTTQRLTPVTTFLGGNDWMQVCATSAKTSFAIKTDGTLWVWGSNNNGILGTNGGGDKLTPVTTFAGGNNWKQVSAVGNAFPFTAAVKTDGTLWTWGVGISGQLGVNGTPLSISTPVTTFVGGNNWKQVTTSRASCAAIRNNGTLWTWGDAAQLGINDSSTNRLTPVQTLLGGTDWKVVSGGTGFAAIKTDGSLWVWGSNDTGQLGTNDTSTKLTPVTTFAGGNNWKQVSGGSVNRALNSRIALKSDGSLWTWGSNAYGKLGNNGSGSVVLTPITTFAGGYNWKQVSAGTYHMIAIRSQDVI